jgi:hypothetical protein
MGACVAAPRFSLSLVWVLEDLSSRMEKRVTESVCLGSLPPVSMVLLCWSSVFSKFRKEVGSEVWAIVIAVVVFLYLLGGHSSISFGLCYGYCYCDLGRGWLLRHFSSLTSCCFCIFCYLVSDVLLR